MIRKQEDTSPFWDAMLESIDSFGQANKLDQTSNMVNHLLCILGTLIRMDPDVAAKLISLIFAWEQTDMPHEYFSNQLISLLPEIEHARKSWEGEILLN